MTARSRRDTQGQRAARQFAAWRAAGVARRLTAEEAKALTGIEIATKEINLSTLASIATA